MVGPRGMKRCHRNARQVASDFNCRWDLLQRQSNRERLLMSPKDYKGLKGDFAPATATPVSDVDQGQGARAAIPADLA